MKDILKAVSVYEKPTIDITLLCRADIITTSGEVEKPTIPDYSGGEWDPF